MRLTLSVESSNDRVLLAIAALAMGAGSDSSMSWHSTVDWLDDGSITHIGGRRPVPMRRTPDVDMTPATSGRGRTLDQIASSEVRSVAPIRGMTVVPVRHIGPSHDVATSGAGSVSLRPSDSRTSDLVKSTNRSSTSPASHAVASHGADRQVKSMPGCSRSG